LFCILLCSGQSGSVTKEDTGEAQETKQKYFYLIPTPTLFTLPLAERRNVATPPLQTNFNCGGFLFVRQGHQENGGLVGVLVGC